jgi:hypothetical protein
MLKPWNVRLAHVHCNNMDHGWRTRIRALLEQQPRWTAKLVRKAYAS